MRRHAVAGCGLAATYSRGRQVAHHRPVRAVALDQAADHAGIVEHAIDPDGCDQAGGARALHHDFGHRSLPHLTGRPEVPNRAMNGPVLWTMRRFAAGVHR